MNIVTTGARYLLGLIFTVFGANGFLHFIKPMPMPDLALQWTTISNASHFMFLPYACQLIAGLLLLSGRYVALALALLAPVIVTIFDFHAALDPRGFLPGLVAAICWVLVFPTVRSHFAGLWQREA